MAQPDDGRDMLFVTEQGGQIRSFPAGQDVTETVVFLDITDRVNEDGNEERALDGWDLQADYHLHKKIKNYIAIPVLLKKNVAIYKKIGNWLR